MHKQDWVNRFRRKVNPYLHALLSEVGGYASMSSSEGEYVGTVKLSKDELEEELHRVGFVRNPVAALKYRVIDGRKEYSRGSWFYFTMEDPVSVAGMKFPKYQYHVTLYDRYGKEGTDVYVHKELFWGTDPEGHYHADYKDYDVEWLRTRFHAEGIEYEINEVDHD